MRSAGLALLFLIAGCAAAPAIPPASAVAGASDARPRLWYVGLGMTGEAWSENDVSEVTGALARGATGYQTVPAVFASGALPRHPDVDPGMVASTLSDIAAHAGPDDLVVIYASTHGAPGLLGRSVGSVQLEPVDVARLRSWLAPLADRNTILILSACFSGSFIPPLAAPHRIIFTAARADRTSFGCQAGAEHTVFGEALLQALTPKNESLHTVVDATRAAVKRRERTMGVQLPSQPQVSVGAAVRRLYDAPVL